MTNLAHLIVRDRVRAGDWVVDATVGNGRDTAFLATCVGADGHVFGFDIQAEALAAARVRLGASTPAVALFHVGHEGMLEALPAEARERVAAVMFNLGYLPGGDKSVITSTETTLRALRAALDLLRVGGIVTVVIYPAHPGGGAEADAVRAFAKQLDGAVAATRHIRLGADRPVPELLVFERLR